MESSPHHHSNACAFSRFTPEQHIQSFAISTRVYVAVLEEATKGHDDVCARYSEHLGVLPA